MADRSDVMQRQVGVPLQSRKRKRWLAAAGGAVVWAFFAYNTGSVLGGTILLILVAAAVVVLMVALRSLGISRDHPWVQRLAARPWRDGRDVLQLALRHLPEVFIVTPHGSLLAPNAIELLMNPGDLAALTQLMDIGLINSSAAEVYQSQISARSASLANPGPVEVGVMADPDVPPGRYRLRQGQPAGLHRALSPLPPLGPPPPAEHPPWMGLPPSPEAAGRGQADRGRTLTPTIAAETATVAALAPVPLLRLVTGGRVGETRTSGARAGRATDADLALPHDPTVSRVHAEFTFADGQWHITNLGLNGITLNGTPVTRAHPIKDGDCIGWGIQPGVPVSRVEIGREAAGPARRWASN